MADYRTEAQKDRDARGMVLFAGQEITREAYDRIRGIEPSTVDGKGAEMPATKFYVRRVSDRNAAGFAFTGPLAAAQAEKERAAWLDADAQYAPTLVPVDADSRAFVRRWQKETRRDDAWQIVTFQGEQMTFAAYRLNHETA